MLTSGIHLPTFKVKIIFYLSQAVVTLWHDIILVNLSLEQGYQTHPRPQTGSGLQGFTWVRSLWLQLCLTAAAVDPTGTQGWKQGCRGDGAQKWWKCHGGKTNDQKARADYGSTSLLSFPRCPCPLGSLDHKFYSSAHPSLPCPQLPAAHWSQITGQMKQLCRPDLVHGLCLRHPWSRNKYCNYWLQKYSR